MHALTDPRPLSRKSSCPGKCHHCVSQWLERSGSLWLQVIGSPLAAGLLALDGVFGLKGFQWLFLVEGLPTVALGMYIHKILVDGPAKAPWLTPEEREAVIHRKAQSLQAGLYGPRACASSCCSSPSAHLTAGPLAHCPHAHKHDLP